MIELGIYHHSDSTSQYKDMGLDWDYELAEVREVTFYRIDAISPIFENGKEYCEVHSNGISYVCVDSYREVKRKLNVLLYSEGL